MEIRSGVLKFDKSESELETDLDKWIHVLNNISRMDKIPAYLRKPIFEKLFSIAAYTNLTKEEKTMYDNSMKYKWDNKNVVDYAREEGKIEGEHKKALEIARKLKKEGLSIEFIVGTTGLSIGEIEQL